MASEIFEPEEAWQFCDDCDPDHTLRYSAKRAFKEHQTSQGHLETTGKPLRDFACPKCENSFSRKSGIDRHAVDAALPSTSQDHPGNMR